MANESTYEGRRYYVNWCQQYQCWAVYREHWEIDGVLYCTADSKRDASDKCRKLNHR